MATPIEIVPAAAANERSELQSIVTWLHERVCRPHEDLGRSGALCPYVMPAVRAQRLWYVLARGADGLSTIIEAVRIARQWFLSAADPHERPSPAALCVFPALRSDDAQIVLEVQRALKSEFVSNGLMLGEFFADYDARGLHNPDFQALTSPVPLLVIRPMVAGDRVFLGDRSEWVEEYSRRFPHHPGTTDGDDTATPRALAFDLDSEPVEESTARREASLREFLSAKRVLSSQESVLLHRLLVKSAYRYQDLLSSADSEPRAT